MNPIEESSILAGEKSSGTHIALHRETLDLGLLAREVLGNEVAHLVTRASGEAVRGKVEGYIAGLPGQAVLVVDFSAVGIMDFSCGDELVAKLVSRLIAGEYGDRYLVLGNVSAEHRENIQVALERKELAVMAWNSGEGRRNGEGEKAGSASGVESGNDGHVKLGVIAGAEETAVTHSSKAHVLKVLGSLNPHLRQALDLVTVGGGATAKVIAKKLGIELNTAGTRLINLHKRRLVMRADRVLSVGGREFIYSPLLWE